MHSTQLSSSEQPQSGGYAATIQGLWQWQEGGGGSSVWISLALLTQMCLLSPHCLVGPVNTIEKKPALDLGELSRD